MGGITGSVLETVLGALPAMRPGEVWLAGAGPGDPALLTLQALAGLRQAELVVHDALIDPRILALASGALVPAGKRGGQPAAHQGDINDELIRLARTGARVLRLKGGDPFVFGRGMDEVAALAAAGIAFRIVPGVTAGLAGLTAALIPATARGVNRALLLATGHGADGAADALDWAAVARLGQPVVLYMGLARIGAIADALVAGGMPATTPAAAIASATLPAQRVLVSTLGALAAEIAASELAAPVIVVIGEIVRLRAELLALMPAITAELAWQPG
jgi:uroporphyrin-III C-methyltransferase